MSTIKNVLLLMVVFTSFTTTLFAQEKNERKAAIVTFYNLFEHGNLENLEKVVSKALIDHDASNPDGNHFIEMEALIKMVNHGFTNTDHELEQIHLIGDDMAVVRWRMTGKHTGNFLGIPATNKQIDFNGHDIFKFKDGLIVESWHVEELLGLMGQLSTSQK